MLALAIQAQDDVAIQAKNDAQAYFVHGVSGLELGVDLDNPIDAWADNKKEAENVKFGQVLGPYFIKPGTYNVKIYVAGRGPDLGFSSMYEFSPKFVAGETCLIVGHWNQKADKIITTRFPLDFSPIHNKKKSRVMVAHCAAYAHLVAAFYDWNSVTEHPYVGNEAMENTDKFVTEIGKGFKWALYVQEAKLDEPGRLLYDKIFKIKPQKAHLAVILCTPKTPSFKVVIATHKKKLK